MLLAPTSTTHTCSPLENPWLHRTWGALVKRSGCSACGCLLGLCLTVRWPMETNRLGWAVQTLKVRSRGFRSMWRESRRRLISERKSWVLRPSWRRLVSSGALEGTPEGRLPVTTSLSPSAPNPNSELLLRMYLSSSNSTRRRSFAAILSTTVTAVSTSLSPIASDAPCSSAVF
ncbi:hypothetical protein EYF80_028155 [Liparis tanakae]|uniref:Uncharacterized protein n=1 Tax=Liparis tanakae TaxID=230148 RepID=A0A4Z2H813_9TELE|nr:hypothetical protein EYF80_028155 [Liparis tanakae]